MESPETPASSHPKPGALPPIAGWLEPVDESEYYEEEVPIDPPLPPKAKRRMALLLVVTLLLGGVTGALLTRQRYRGRQVVASVNGVVIDEPYFLHRMEMETGNNTLRQMVSEELQLQYARKVGVYPSETEVQARYKQMSSQPTFGQYLVTTRQTPDDVLHNIRVTLAADGLVTKDAIVSDAEVRAYYERNADKNNPQARYYTPKTVSIEVIKTHSEPQIKQAAAALAKNTPFAQVAAKYSDDASRSAGGVLPPVPYGRTPSTRVTGAQDRVFGLQIGEQMGPIQMAGFWWIIRCLDKKPETLRSFEEVKDECRHNVLVAKGLPANGEKVRENYRKFMKDANIRAFWPQYKYIIGGK